jgi:hypothetical protein
MNNREMELKVASRLKEIAFLLEVEERSTSEQVKAAITGLIGELFIMMAALSK